MSEVKTMSGRQLSMMRRKALSGGKGVTIADVETQALVEPKAKNTTKPATTTKARVGSKVAVKRDAIIQGGRAQSIAYRKASGQGKTAQKSFKTSSSVSVAAKAAGPQASTKEIAKQVRLERCTRGKCATKSSTSKKGRVRPTTTADDVSATTSGQEISGTRVGKNTGITGAKKGSCKAVSGTEYLGVEEFATCDTKPNTRPQKVSTTTTHQGMKVSGTEVGLDEVLTGNNSGKCASITGTEYLPAENQNDFCGTKGSTSSVKKQTGFSVISQANNTNSRTDITNSGNNRNSQSTTIKSSVAPQKVVSSQTFKGNTTTGTQVGRTGNDITGNQGGVCENVTGVSYVGVEEVEGCDTKPTDGATKVVVSGTGNGQVITGDRSGGDDGITGSKSGNCQAVTGTSYVGAENAAACDSNAQQEITARAKQTGNTQLSGTEIAPTGLTGASKGACSLITGEQAYSTNATSVVCASTTAANIGDSDYPLAANATTASTQVSQATQNDASAITGDGWDRGDKVTGTEGEWAAGRNASLKGNAMQMPVGAGFRPEDNSVPMSPITGSSGNTDTGAKVTLSGGARA